MSTAYTSFIKDIQQATSLQAQAQAVLIYAEQAQARTQELITKCDNILTNSSFQELQTASSSINTSPISAQTMMIGSTG
jgi:GTP-binding protein EngB required for normal cell division